MIRLTLATAVLLLAGCGSADPVSKPAAPVKMVAAPTGSDWISTVVATPDGGFRMGNPNAPITLIEYGSLTCPHCAAFSKDGVETLKAKYVATGKVSYEFRSFLLHGQDLMATTVRPVRWPVAVLCAARGGVCHAGGLGWQADGDIADRSHALAIAAGRGAKCGAGAGNRA